jgi:hypothetical protein
VQSPQPSPEALDLDPATQQAANAVEEGLARLRTDLELLIAAARRLSQHIGELQARTPRLVKIHTPPSDASGAPVKRGRGRPKGARTQVLHVVASSSAEARTIALDASKRL